MRLSKSIVIFLSNVCLVAVCLVPSSLSAQPLTSVDVAENVVFWFPSSPGTVTLTVSGPAVYHRQVFDAGNQPQLGVLQNDGTALPDGSYTWELVISPVDPGGLSSTALRQSGYLNVEQGSFVDLSEGLEARPFTIEDDAPAQALHLDEAGRYGIGTATPATNVHVMSSSAPTLRLEQDVRDGATSHAWDLSGDDQGFSVRDVDSLAVPFFISQNAADNTLVLEDNVQVGIGTPNPDATLHIQRADGTAQLHVEDNETTAGVSILLNLETQNRRPRFMMHHGGVNTSWNFDILNVTGDFAFIRGGGGPTFVFNSTNGNLSIEGEFISNGVTLTVPDYVFDDTYDLMPLDEVRTFIENRHHLPEIPSAAQVKSEGLNITEMQLRLLQKVEELTLYTLEQHDTNRQQHEIINSQREAIDTLQEAVQVLQREVAALRNTSR